MSAPENNRPMAGQPVTLPVQPVQGEKQYIIPHGLAQAVLEYITSCPPPPGQPIKVGMLLYSQVQQLQELPFPPGQVKTLMDAGKKLIEAERKIAELEKGTSAELVGMDPPPPCPQDHSKLTHCEVCGWKATAEEG